MEGTAWTLRTAMMAKRKSIETFMARIIAWRYVNDRDGSLLGSRRANDR